MSKQGEVKLVVIMAVIFLVSLVSLIWVSYAWADASAWKEREAIDIMDDSAYYFTELKGTTVKDLDFPYKGIESYLSYSCSTEHWLNGFRKFGVPIAKKYRDKQNKRIAQGNPPVHCDLELRFNKESRVPTKETHGYNNRYLYYRVQFRFDKEEKGNASANLTAWEGAIYMMNIAIGKGLESGEHKNLLLQVPWGTDDYAIFKFNIVGADTVLDAFNKRHFCPEVICPTSSQLAEGKTIEILRAELDKQKER